MEFVTNGNQIDCIRRVACNQTQEAREITIVSFDNNQEVIPPHVAACLTPEENKQLQGWLYERAVLTEKLEKDSIEETVLDALPELLIKAREALEKVETIDFELFKRLKISLRELDERLNRFHRLVEESSLELDNLQAEEVLKEKLENIKESL